MRSTSYRWIHRRRGFTLMEMLFTMAIGSFILTGIITTYVFSVRGFRALSNYNELQSSGRRSMDWFARDIRASIAVSTYLTNKVVVLIPSAVNSNGVVTATNTVTHTLLNGAWRRTTAAGGNKMLSTNVTTLAFSIYDQAGTVTTQATQAVSIQVDAILTKSVKNKTQSSEFLSARFRMRNTP